jgi:transposase
LRRWRNEWAKHDEIDKGEREGLTHSEREQIKAMQREVKQLRRAYVILKTASAFFRPGGARSST